MVVHPDTRDAFREEQISEIRKRIRREYQPRIRAAKNRAEKKVLRAERDAVIEKEIEPLVLERDRRYPPGHCLKCGYNLTGNVSGVCPECGTAFVERSIYGKNRDKA